MNALPLKTGRAPSEVIDELIADYGFRRVFLAIVARVVRRTRPPDITAVPRLGDQPEVHGLSDHVRRDIGLEPHASRNPHTKLAAMTRRDWMSPWGHG